MRLRLLVLISAGCLVACSTPPWVPPASQALWSDWTNDSEVCVPSRQHTAHTVGLDTFESSEPVQVTNVTWLDEQGMEKVEFRFVQHRASDPNGMFGVWNGNPPELDPKEARASLAVWKRARPLESATLPVAGEDDSINVLIGFSGTDGSAGPLRIDCVDGQGRRGSAVGRVTVEVRPVCR